MSAPRLLLKQSTGWFAAGWSFGEAMFALSDAAFKVFAWLCLNADRYTGRVQITIPEMAQALRRIRELSDREREVLQLLGSGESNAELARRLYVSEATVKTYVSRLLTKLGLANRTQAAILAHEAGLLEG